MELGAGSENQRYEGVTSREATQSNDRTDSSLHMKLVQPTTPPKLASESLAPRVQL